MTKTVYNKHIRYCVNYPILNNNKETIIINNIVMLLSTITIILTNYNIIETYE